MVELIVVLVILAILASLLIPALTGYVTKAKKQAVITEARDVWTASQAALTECYALYPESFNDKSNSCRFTITVNGKTYKNVGRITNGALHAIQKNRTIRQGGQLQPESGRPGAEVSGERRQKSALYLWQRRPDQQRYQAERLL
ncbi:MAG: type II secretion system protein [Subdoligranulum sp.]|nr:type II secretion system protein [Subdoligranulum sp.]